MSRLLPPNAGREWTVPATVARATVAVLVALFLVHALALHVVIDDSFISYRYAEHLARGHGLVWNIGDPPVEGYTNFLWVAVLALADRLGLALVHVAVGLGLLAGAGVLWLVLRIARRWFGPGPAAFVPLVLLAACGPLATWSAAGLETSLFALLVLAALHEHLVFQRTGSGPALARSVALVLLASLTRPEGVLVAAVLAAGGCVQALRAGGRRRDLGRIALAYALLYTLPGLIYFGWRLDTFGHFFPNTFYAKTGYVSRQVVRGSKYGGYFLLYFGSPLAALAAVWIAARLASVRHPPAGPEVAAAGGPPAGELALSGAMVAVYVGYIAAIGGDYLPMFRFFVPVLPFIYLLAGAVFFDAWRRSARGRRSLLLAALAVAVAGTVYHSTPLERDTFGRHPVCEGTYRGVQFQRWNTARLSLIGRHFQAAARSADESIATRAVGAIAWYSRLRVEDVLGLVDEHIAHRGSWGRGRGLPGHEKRDWVYILDKRPTYIVLSSTLAPEPLPLPALTGDMAKPEVERAAAEYDVASVWLVDPHNGAAGYLSYLERRGHAARTTPGMAATSAAPNTPAASPSAGLRTGVSSSSEKR